jgi:glutaryl-CoA transferase
MSEPKSALAGVRVLDLSRVLAGPWATQSLGDLGADVIKVEKPGAGDDTRAWGPPFLKTADGAEGDASYYLAANRNKRSLAVDFATPEGAEIIRRLIPRCQIMVENFKTGSLARYGLDHASAAKLNPALVYCSITGFGQNGPYAAKPGYDYMIQAMGGLMSITGEADGAPMKVGVAVADLFSGMYATTAMLAALRHAERSGEGQHIDIALLDCQIAMLANQATAYLASGVAPTRLGNAHPSVAPYQPFATRDGFIVVAVGTDGQFRAFCAAIGAPELATDTRFASNALRVRRRAELAALITTQMKMRSASEWIAALDAANVPCGPINAIDDVFADAHVQARRAAQTMTRADGTEVRMPANPIRMSATPPDPRRAPPLLGQDTEAVLHEMLGASAEDISRWRSAGAI